MKEKLLLSESIEHKIPYVDLLEKYEKEKKLNNAFKTILEQNDKTINMLNKSLYDDNTIIRAYRKKLIEHENDFNPFIFENEIINKNKE